MQERWKKYGSIMLMFLLIFLSRFLTEFMRDPSSSPFRNELFGIRYFQWFLLLMATATGIILMITEQPGKMKVLVRTEEKPSVNKPILYIFLISVLIFLFRGLFSLYEKASLYLILFPAVVMTLYHIHIALSGNRIKIISSSLMVLPVLLVFPAFYPDTTRTKKPEKVYYQNEFSRYKRIDAGTTFGKYYSTVYYNPHQGECGTTYSSEDYEHLFNIIGGGYSVTTNGEDIIITKGINIYGGINDEHNLTRQEYMNYFLWGVNPYIKIDRKWYGAGTGLHAGNLRWIVQKQLNTETLENGTRFSPVLPELMLRLGRKDIIDVMYSYGMHSYSTFPVLSHELSVGTGLGNKTDMSFRFGGIFSEMTTTPFISGEWVIKKKIGMNLKYQFGTTSNYYGQGVYYGTTQAKSKGIITFGAGYRFGFEK